MLYRSILFIFCTLLLFNSCKKKEEFLNGSNDKSQQRIATANGFELSYWIDIDLRQNNSRGYWKHVNDPLSPPNPTPTSSEIWSAVSRCRYSYHGLSLYVIYHRQFEIAEAKQALLYWKQYGDQMGVKIIPTVVLEDYVLPASVNFTDTEIPAFAKWCIETLHASEFGVYDIYSYRQQPGTAQNTQLGIIKSAIGNKIVRVGLQPHETVNPNFLRAVEDTWTAECEGKTNAYWENPVNYNDSSGYGRNRLMNWVRERIAYNSISVTWNLIPVAWDYDKYIDPYGYTYPGDDAELNDPPIAGRVSLCHSYLVAAYAGGSSDPKFGGYSCDLRIVHMNSTGKLESPSFYERIRADQLYTGYFASGINQVAAVYDLYDN
jgi:hypothetical protein